MIVIFIFELSGGIAGFVLRNDANEYVKNQMNHSLKTFNESKTSHLIWDKVQEQVNMFYQIYIYIYYISMLFFTYF